MTPPSDAARADTYAALIDGIIAHPLFPLVVKKVFDVCGSTAFERSHLIPHFSDTENTALGLQQFAETHGLRPACERWTSTDVFMSTMVTALNRISTSGSNGHVALQHTIDIGKKALTNSWSDPRYVGATDTPRVDVHQRPPPISTNAIPANSIPKSEGLDRSDKLKPLGDITQRTGSARILGVRKARHATRTPLSEKAKATLERWFQEHLENPYPSSKQKEELATLCAVSLSSVNNWFGNKRMRIKRKMLQVTTQDTERISDRVLAPKSKWNAVVVSKLSSQAGRDVLANATGRALPPKEKG